MFCAWIARPDVLALAERLMTKPFGSRVRATRMVLGPVETGAEPLWPPLAPWLAGAGAHAARVRATPSKANNVGRGRRIRFLQVFSRDSIAAPNPTIESARGDARTAPSRGPCSGSALDDVQRAALSQLPLLLARPVPLGPRAEHAVRRARLARAAAYELTRDARPRRPHADGPEYHPHALRRRGRRPDRSASLADHDAGRSGGAVLCHRHAGHGRSGPGLARVCRGLPARLCPLLRQPGPPRASPDPCSRRGDSERGAARQPRVERHPPRRAGRRGNADLPGWH